MCLSVRIRRRGTPGRRRGGGGLVLALLLGVALPAGRAAARERLVVASCEFEPYFGQALPANGPVAQLTRMALEKAGYEVELRFLPWARVLKEAQAGKIDVVFGMWRTPEREAWVAFSEPLVVNEIGLYGRRGDRRPFTGLAALRAAGVAVGAVRGYANPPAVEASGVDLDEVVDDETNVKKLLAGRVQLILIDRGIGAFLAAKLGRAEELEWIVTLERKPLLDGVIKTSGKDWRRILADLDRELAALRRTGVAARILEGREP